MAFQQLQAFFNNVSIRWLGRPQHSSNVISSFIINSEENAKDQLAGVHYQNFCILFCINIAIDNCQSTWSIPADTPQIHKTQPCNTTRTEALQHPFLLGSPPHTYAVIFSNDEFTFIRNYHTIPITKNYFLESPYYSLLPINYPARIHMVFFFVQPVYDIYYETNIFLKKICRFP